MYDIGEGVPRTINSTIQESADHLCTTKLGYSGNKLIRRAPVCLLLDWTVFDALTIDKTGTFNINFIMSRRISGIFLGYLEYLT